MRRCIRTLAFGLLALALGCGGGGSGSNGAVDVDVTGRWAGDVNVLGIGTASVDADLTMLADGRVEGTASIGGLTRDPVAGSLVGLVDGRAVTLVADDTLLGTVTFDGDLVGNDEMRGRVRISSAGDVALSLILRRQNGG